MTTPEAIETINLDQYGDRPMPWDAVVDLLDEANATNQDLFTVLGTVRPDGRPHAAPIGARWIDGAWYIVTGPGTRKGRNLAVEPACTLSVRLEGIDMVFSGTAHRVVDRDELEQIAAVYRDGGWPAEVEDDAFTAPFTAPSGGPPPWHLFRMTTEQAVGVGTVGSVPGATKWTFS